MTSPRIPKQREIIDRRELARHVQEQVARHGPKARTAVLELLRTALQNGRATIARRLIARPSAGHDCAAAHAFLIDQLVRVIHDHVSEDVYPAANRSTGERLAIMAVGGYGRGEMAPHSDVDIAFLMPGKRTPWCEQVIEAILYFLWDLQLEVGHSTRSIKEMIRLGRADTTIRTALLEGRYVWGDMPLYEEATQRFRAEVIIGHERQYITDKLEECAARHHRMGDTRYVVEPNVKDGKGGLRDLHTLYWIGKYIHRVRTAAELVDVGLLSTEEYRAFRRAENFFWAVRCHMHTITGRREDRLTFDLQREVAERMKFIDRPGKSAVENFMQYFFRQARRVGSLTGVFLAQLDEQFTAPKPKGLLAGFQARRRKIGGYVVFGGRISAPSDSWFRDDPVRLLEIFALAEKENLKIHPNSLRMAARDAGLITAQHRKDPRANALFMDILCGRNNPESVLRWMNESGVFGRFIPDFGRVNAQMQFDMYHHYTVDEHTIHAIGLLSRIEKGERKAEHPLITALIPKLGSRRVAYVAVLLHDIAKGRGGDHSVLGAGVAARLCPRLGLDEAETELVKWLVRNHLLMSATAFKRDLADPKTILDFVGEVQGLERLRQLLVLTVVDICAVGPGVWNSWKSQLLTELFDAAEEQLRLGHKQHGRKERVAGKKAAIAAQMGPLASLVETVGDNLADAYWIAEPEDIITLNLQQLHDAQAQGQDPSIRCHYYPARGATLVSVIADDHPGLFYHIAGGIHLAGGNIIDARIHTTSRGQALDNFLVQDPLGQPFMEENQLKRITTSIRDTLADKADLEPALAKRPLARRRAEAFDVRPRLLFDNKASNRFTVIEVNARDAPALLSRLGKAMFEAGLTIHSAHVTNYGERAVDTFYVTDFDGGKITSDDRLALVEGKLLTAAAGQDSRKADEAAA